MIDIRFIQEFADKEVNIQMGQSALEREHRKQFKADFFLNYCRWFCVGGLCPDLAITAGRIY